MKLRQKLIAAAALVGMACSDTSVPELDQAPTTESKLEGLAAAGLRDIPCDDQGNLLFEGSRVSLLLMDALASCVNEARTRGQRSPHGGCLNCVDVAAGYERVWATSTDMVSRATYHDAQHVFQNSLVGQWGFDFGLWLRNRNNTLSISDPPDPDPDPDDDVRLFEHCSPGGDGDPAIRGLGLPDALNLGLYAIHGNTTAANFENMEAPVRLCVAQQLRTSLPGAAGSEALLLNENEQRHLLMTIRDYAQISMVQYAILGAAYSGSSSQTVEQVGNGMNPSTTVGPALAAWANQSTDIEGGSMVELLTKMGEDFAAAVQLHITVTDELASLFARSRSSRSPVVKGQLGTEADATWGPGSWQQRLLALMYGGDPLVNVESGTWQHLSLGSFAEEDQAWFRQPASALQPRDWFSKAEFPYLRDRIREPQPWRLIALGQQRRELVFTGTVPIQEIWEASAGGTLFHNVDVNLRGLRCTGCPPVPPPALEDTALWRLHRITPEHADAAAAFLRTALGQVLDPTPLPPGAVANLYNIIGQVSTPGGSIDLSTAGLQPRSLRQVAPLFSSASRYFVPTANYFSLGSNAAVPAHLGLLSNGAVGLGAVLNPVDYDPLLHGWSAEERRRMGSISALSLTRDLILDVLGKAAPTNPRRQDFYASSGLILDLINGAIGADGVTIRPRFVVTGGNAATLPDSQGRTVRSVHAVEDPQDTFWTTFDRYYVVASADRAASNFALVPGSANAPTEINGRTLEEVIVQAIDQKTFAQLHRFGAAGQGYWTTLGGLDGGFDSELSVPQAASPPGMPNTLFVVGTTLSEWDALTDLAHGYGSGPQLEESQVRLLAGNLPLRHADVLDLHSLAYGGTLGNFVEQQISVLAEDPSIPAYDGFGLPTRWVPPTDPELLAAGGQDATRYFLDLAKSSAADAAGAVERAFQNVTEELRDESARAAAIDRSTLLLEQASEALCGTDNADCDVQLVSTSPLSTWYPSLDGYQFPDPQICQQTVDQVQGHLRNGGQENNVVLAGQLVDCITADVVGRVLSQPILVAEPVFTKLNEGVSTIPTFAEFSGGSLQSIFVEQFRALSVLEERLATLLAAANAAKQAGEVAAEVAEAAGNEVERACGAMSLADGFMTTTSGGLGLATTGAALGGAVACLPGAIVGGAVGGIVGGLAAWWSADDEKEKACERAQEAEGIAKQQEISQYFDSIAAMRGAVSGTISDIAAIAQAGISAHFAKAETDRATAAIQLEGELAQRGQLTSFDVVRQYRSYDLWRAKALLENARRYALAARRSIENRFVTNLSDLTANEPFVAAPATWADEIYEYDLSLPGAVGLSVGTSVETSDGIFPNKVVDYVNNLESFVAGYSVERPTAAGVEDVEVISLRGLATVEEDSDAGAVGAWQLFCEEPGVWLAPPTSASGEPVDARGTCTDFSECASCDGDVECAILEGCYTAPTRARVQFDLDPWGRVGGDAAIDSFHNRYNARWGLLAVNIVGTGVRDCSRADDTLGCHAEGFINFDLTHSGTAWVTDFRGEWRALRYPTGKVESGKALAAEVWLDPLKDGWDSSYISPIARSELVDRPMAGEYSLTLELTPDVRIDRIERVQLLQGSKYWVAQTP